MASICFSLHTCSSYHNSIANAPFTTALIVIADATAPATITTIISTAHLVAWLAEAVHKHIHNPCADDVYVLRFSHPLCLVPMHT